MPLLHPLVRASIALSLFALTQPVIAQDYKTGIEWQDPPVVTPGAEPGEPPSDAVVLFDGTDLSAWENGENWKIVDGIAIIGEGSIRTKQLFGDCQLHLEWLVVPSDRSIGQDHGNSGVFFMQFENYRGYEVQILNSYQNKVYLDGMVAAVYKQTPPMANAMVPPGEWNVYDLIWTSPRFNDDGSLQSPAYVTVFHNGVVVQNHFELLGNTAYHRPPRYEAHPAKGAIALQDHGNPVRFRNIWVREIKNPVGQKVREPYFLDPDGRKIPASKASSH